MVGLVHLHRTRIMEAVNRRWPVVLNGDTAVPLPAGGGVEVSAGAMAVPAPTFFPLHVPYDTLGNLPEVPGLDIVLGSFVSHRPNFRLRNAPASLKVASSGVGCPSFLSQMTCFGVARP